MVGRCDGRADASIGADTCGYSSDSGNITNVAYRSAMPRRLSDIGDSNMYKCSDNGVDAK
jgi:hypothetical protein